MLEDMEALFSLDINASSAPDTGSNCFCFPDLKSQVMGFHVLPEEKRISSSEIKEKCLMSDSKKTSELLFEPSSLHKYSCGMREMKLELFFGENEDEPLVSGIILPLLNSQGGRDGHYQSSLSNSNKGSSSSSSSSDHRNHGNLNSSNAKNYNTIKSSGTPYTYKASSVTGHAAPLHHHNSAASRASASVSAGNSKNNNGTINNNIMNNNSKVSDNDNNCSSNNRINIISSIDGSGGSNRRPHSDMPALDGSIISSPVGAEADAGAVGMRTGAPYGLTMHMPPYAQSHTVSPAVTHTTHDTMAPIRSSESNSISDGDSSGGSRV